MRSLKPHASDSMEPAETMRIAGSHIWLPSSKMALAVQRLVRTSYVGRSATMDQRQQSPRNLVYEVTTLIAQHVLIYEDNACTLSKTIKMH